MSDTRLKALTEVARAAYVRGVADKAAGTVQTGETFVVWLRAQMPATFDVALAVDTPSAWARIAVALIWVGVGVPLLVKLWTWAF